MDNLPAHSKKPLCTAYGSQVNHTKDQALSKRLFFFDKRRLSYLSAALQDRRALPSCYVKNDVTTRIDSPCSGLLRLLAAAPSYTLQRHIPSCCFCFSPRLWAGLPTPFFKSWPLVATRYALSVSAKALSLRGSRGCDARSHVWAVCKNSPFHPTVVLEWQHRHASNPFRRDKSPL